MSSSRQIGNGHENSVCKYLETEYGYYTYPSRGSRGIDVICLRDNWDCFANLPYLGLEIGTESKSVTAAFKKIRSQPQYPGMAMMVVRRIKGKNGRYFLRWHIDDGVKGHDDFMEAIEAWREI